MPSPRRSRSPVEVRSVNDPRPGWDVEQALALVREGYPVEYVERRTGFAASHLRAVLQQQEREQRERASRPT